MYIREAGYRSLGEITGQFEGTFSGSILGDSKTKATATAVLVHRDNNVNGKVLIGRGLRLAFGLLCKEEDVDLTEIPINTTTDAANPLRFTTATQVLEPTIQWGLAFLKTDVSITAEFSPADNRTIKATVRLKPVKGLNADLTESNIPIPCSAKTLVVNLTRQ